MEKDSITPGSIIMWSLASMLVVIFATALGQTIGNPYDGGMLWFLKGIAAMAIAGVVGAQIAKRFREAIFFGKKTNQGGSDDAKVSE